MTFAFLMLMGRMNSRHFIRESEKTAKGRKVARAPHLLSGSSVWYGPEILVSFPFCTCRRLSAVTLYGEKYRTSQAGAVRENYEWNLEEERRKP